MAKKKKNKIIKRKKRGNLYHGTYGLTQREYKILTPPKKKAYSPDNTPMIAYRLALLGMSHRDIASTFGVSYTTLKVWKKNYPYFREWIDKGSVYADALVANSLLKTAVGYTVEDTKHFVVKGEVVSVVYEKHILPDRKACMDWLTNRQPKYWKSEANLNRNTTAENSPVVEIKFIPSGIPAITSENTMIKYSQELDESGFYDKLNGNGEEKD